MVPIYATVSMLSIHYYTKHVYFEVLRDCYEAFAISSFFTLLCNYISPELHDQKDYFRAITPHNWVWPLNWCQKCTGGEKRGWLRKPRSGLTWFNVGCLNLNEYAPLHADGTLHRSFTFPSSNTASFAFSSPSYPSSPSISTSYARTRFLRNTPTFGSSSSSLSPSRSQCTASSNSTRR